jgi:hypothetical protein
MRIGVCTPFCRRSRQTSKAVLLRQRDVEEDAVEAPARRGLDRGFTIASDHGLVAFAHQPVLQREDETLFVFDEEDAAMKFVRHGSIKEVSS